MNSNLTDINSDMNKYKIKIENFEGPLDLLCKNFKSSIAIAESESYLC